MDKVDKEKIIKEHFQKLQKKSAKKQFGSMTKEEKSEHFRNLQKKSAEKRRKVIHRNMKNA